jgi:hypothetical protein
MYTKHCFPSRLNSIELHVCAPEIRERGAQHYANHFEDGGVVTLIDEDKVGGICR